MAIILPASINAEEIVATIGSRANSTQLANALAAICAHNKDMTDDLIVELGDVSICLDKPLQLNVSHSGSNGHDVVFRAARGAKPMFSGGDRIEYWTVDDRGRWKSKLNGRAVRQLFVNGNRAQRARGSFPEDAERYGDLRSIDSDAGFIVRGSSIAQWKNPRGIELGFYNSWSHMTCMVDSITNDNNGRTRIRMQDPVFMLASRKEGVRAEMPAYIENALELLDEPGEWYADASNDTLYYMPRRKEKAKSGVAVITDNDELLCIDEGAHNIRFEGITFAEAAAGEPTPGGVADVQANFEMTADNLYERDGALVNVHNEHRKPGAAVVIKESHHIVFDGCTFTRIGGAALNIEAAKDASEVGAHDVSILSCEFFDIGGSAIQIGDVGRYAHHPINEEQIVRKNRVQHCKIHDVGVEFEGSVGIFVGYARSTNIESNAIYDLPYSGISIGWGWGEEDAGGSTYPIPFVYESPTPAGDNRIANNHIHHVMQKRLDGGGIYTLGNQPNTVIEGNHIHDNKGWPGGIYLDEGSGFITVQHNRVYNVPTPMNFNNKNQNRIETCHVHDNEFEEKKN